MEKISELRNVINDRVENTNQVFLLPHKSPDFDAIGSCAGIYEFLRKYNKKVYIVIGERLVDIEPGVKSMMEDIITNISFINIETYNKIKSDNDLLIMCDVNRDYLLYDKDIINNFNKDNIIIIDHHNEDEHTVNTNNRFIKPDQSSASEIISELLILNKCKIDESVANYLLAGIYLDTNKFQKNCKSKTMSIISKLMSKGADINTIDNYFAEDFISDRKVQELIGKARFYTYRIAVAIADDSVEYTKEELAKAADYLLKYKADATFAVGNISDDLISISARSKGKILVGDVMCNFENGGGNNFSAAAKISNSNLHETEEKLIKSLVPQFYKIEKS